MNWDRIQGRWHQIKGKVKERWGILTDGDLEAIGGQREQLLGKLQERYGYAKDRAEKDLKDFEASLDKETREQLKEQAREQKKEEKRA